MNVKSCCKKINKKVTVQLLQKPVIAKLAEPAEAISNPQRQSYPVEATSFIFLF